MNTTLDARLTRIITTLNEREAAKVVSSPEDNPFNNMTLDDVAGRQEIPALNMAAKAPDSGLAYDMEVARFEAKEKGAVDRSAVRMAQAKARAERKVAFDKIAESPVRPNQARMDEAWLVVSPLVGTVHQIAKGKQRWANRLLGSNADDIPSLAIEKMALVLAKSDQDLKVLRESALGIKATLDNTGKVHNEVIDPDDKEAKKHRKDVKKGRKWLMGLVNNRVMGALVDSFTSERNLRWDNIDIIATVIASINGPGDDPITDRFKADRAPAFLGTRFPSPGGIDGNLIAMGITAAITDRGLDPLVEFLLDDDNRRVDGYVKWSECAEEIFMLTPNGEGEWMWGAVEHATATLKHARRERGIAARTHVRNLFAFLPDLIGSLVNSFDHHPVGWTIRSDGQRAVMASDFESFYLHNVGQYPLGEQRFPLEPALTYTTPREAAQALTQYLANLTTGSELLASARNA